MHRMLELVPFAMFEQTCTAAEKCGKKEIYLWLLYESCQRAYETN